MKLKDWADKQGVRYLTAYRWFKAGKMPVPCYQTDSGTIIVEIPEKNMQDESDKAVSQFLKKTVEFSKNNTSIEDFAAYVISNYKLEKSDAESQKSIKSKPTQEMTNQHFSKFLKKTDKKPEANMFLMNESALNTITKASADAASSEEALAKELSSIFDPQGASVGTVMSVNANYTSMIKNDPSVKLMAQDLGSALKGSNVNSTIKTMQNISSGAVITRSLSQEPIDVGNTTQSVSGNFYSTSSNYLNDTLPFTPLANYDDNNGASFQRIAEESSSEENDKVSYDEARLLVDVLVKLNQIPHDFIQMDKKTKEVCSWSRSMYDSIIAIVCNQGK